MNTLIITGGKVNIKFLKNLLNTNKYDIIIAVDKGLESLYKIHVTPNYIIGDFDSINKKILDKYRRSKSNIKEFIPEKDFTDTEAGIRLAIELKSTEITLIGATGTRLDHVIANIHILKIALENHVNAKIIDENNEIRLIDKTTKIEKDNNFKYISLIPLTTYVTGITLKGFKYCLNNYDLNNGTSLTVSNEQIENDSIVELKDGILIIIKSRD